METHEISWRDPAASHVEFRCFPRHTGWDLAAGHGIPWDPTWYLAGCRGTLLKFTRDTPREPSVGSHEIPPRDAAASHVGFGGLPRHPGWDLAGGRGITWELTHKLPREPSVGSHEIPWDAMALGWDTEGSYDPRDRTTSQVGTRGRSWHVHIITGTLFGNP